MMNPIFMNSVKDKPSDVHRLRLNLERWSVGLRCFDLRVKT